MEKVFLKSKTSEISIRTLHDFNEILVLSGHRGLKLSELYMWVRLCGGRPPSPHHCINDFNGILVLFTQ